MTKHTQTALHPTIAPVYLASGLVNNLIICLPAGTAYFIGIVLIVMMTGELMQHKGSLARAALPYVIHLRWGWHRVHRALERGKFCLDMLFDRAADWCLQNLPIEPVTLGEREREVGVIDSTTIARLRASQRTALLGKGYCHRAGRAVKANIVAASTSVVMINGRRVGLVRRVRFGLKSEEAVEAVFTARPQPKGLRLTVIDRGIATEDRFIAATEEETIMGRLRKNVKLRCAPPERKKKAGRGAPRKHGKVLHPGAKRPEVKADEDYHVVEEEREIRIRRWKNLHFEKSVKTIIDVVRVDSPAYNDPLIVGTNARELRSEEIRVGYKHRWPIETNFYVAEETTAMEKPRAWTEEAIKRRISLALLVGSMLKATAAVCAPLPMGPWDRQAQRSGGRLANYLSIHAREFSALCLKGVAPRKYEKIVEPWNTNELEQKMAACIGKTRGVTYSKVTLILLSTY